MTERERRVPYYLHAKNPFVAAFPFPPPQLERGNRMPPKVYEWARGKELGIRLYFFFPFYFPDLDDVQACPFSGLVRGPGQPGPVREWKVHRHIDSRGIFISPRSF